MELFPADDIDVDEALSTLVSSAFIQRYRVDDQACIQIVNFTKHQRPHSNEAASAIPPFPAGEASDEEKAPERPHEIKTAHHGEQPLQPRQSTRAGVTDTGYLEPDTGYLNAEPPPNPPRGELSKQQETRFEVFWFEYPRKEGKGAARSWWAKKKPSAELVDQMLRSIEGWRKSAQWLKDDGQFVPMPSTWLNQSRWEDDIPPPATVADLAPPRTRPPMRHVEGNLTDAEVRDRIEGRVAI
jgi:hypothetical protein